jgi:hypothetical protein
MKEHSFFLELGFTPRDASYTKQAETFRREFDRLLWEVVSISDGAVSTDVLKSGEVFTQYTIDAERASSFYTGINIPIEITQAEAGLLGSAKYRVSAMLEDRVYRINERAIELISQLIQFKTTILNNVLSCRMFTQNYPLLIDHIMREAKLYVSMVQRLQDGGDLSDLDALEQEIFWNTIMAEHSKFIRGLLDPTEDDLFKTADNFGSEFDQLTKEAAAAMNNTVSFEKVTQDSLDATKAIRDFKSQGTAGIIDCKIKSIIIPLLGDHTIREASHYLRLLNTFKQTM